MEERSLEEIRVAVAAVLPAERPTLSSPPLQGPCHGGTGDSPRPRTYRGHPGWGGSAEREVRVTRW